MQALTFLAPFATKYWKSLVLTVISMLALVGVQLYAPWIIREMIGLVSAGLSADSYRRIGTLALFALGVYALRGGLTFVRSYMAHVAGWGVVAEVRTALYRHLQKLSLRFYEDRQTGQLMSRVVNDTDKIETLVAHAIPDVLVNILTFIAVNIVLFAINPMLMLLCLIPVPLIVIGMRGFGRYVRPAFRERQKELGELNASLADNLSGIREIKAFAQEERVATNVGEHINRYMRSLLHALKLMATFHPFVEFSSSLGMIIVIYFGGRLAMGQALPVEDLVAYFLYLEMLYQPVRMLSSVWENVQEALAGTERVAEIMEVEPEEPSTLAGRGTSAIAASSVMQPRARGELTFDQVGFQYIDDTPVLSDISVSIPAGSVAALVGPTGVGKTTFASLIPRFYEVTSGRILLDGVDTRELPLPYLRSQISIVLQDVFLFHGTARDNILFARPDATEDEVIAAARAANADEFIDTLPNGYDTIIGERGVKLSGGQKQRLSIARALLADKPILILDEATSSVDTETEQLIQQALERLMVGRTTIIIAHRLSTVRKANTIVVLQEGRVAERGNHTELIAARGIYHSLHDTAELPA
ncbi:MAG: ABC transporter ATP-binding protein [Spirochaetaceae bacterium]|nr:MAG: ABC transporter ATP-binding protein [Spirochaetaceae bacterium]